MSYELEPYQGRLKISIAHAIKEHRSVLVQSETGSGKTVIFAAIAYGYVKNTDKDVIIFVHKKELLEQARRTIFNWYGIVAHKIDAKTTHIAPGSRVFVAMVETFNNRSLSSKFLDNFKNVGIAIFDEAHLNHFKKLFLHFCEARRIGFTATPISATKKDPLLNHYKTIVIGPTVKELIEVNKQKPDRGVVPVVTYSLKNINRSELKTKGDEFDEDAMGEAFSRKKQIQNTIDAYIKYGYGKKTLCFNSNIEHSILMNQAFLDAGLNSRHLNGPSANPKYKKYGTDDYRDACFRWLRETPNAILCNVGIATTGFDDPSIEIIIINKSTKSLPLYRQICGRGARPYIYPNREKKTHYTVLDMGDNVVGGGFGEWSDYVDWKFIFENPKIPREGIASVKNCPECGAINAASARICQGIAINPITDEEEECGYCFPIATAQEDTVFKEMVRIGTLDIDVPSAIEFFKDRKEYFVMFELYRQIAHRYRETIPEDYLDSEQLEGIFEAAYIKISQWHKLMDKRKFPNFRSGVQVSMIKELENVGFIITGEEMAELNKPTDSELIQSIIDEESQP